MTTALAEPDLIIRPCLPPFGGIFDLPGRETPVATHMPHAPFENLEEHLHEHLPHLHISYGFEIARHELEHLPESTHLEVVMAIKKEHRVDCNPIFVNRKNASEGECLKIGGEDVHWIHSEETARKATELFARTGRRLPEDMYFSGFLTSTPDERETRAYTREELFEAIGDGLLVEQHFQATWLEPREEPIDPYDVIIYLGSTDTRYHTFFRLPAIVPLGAS
ncbi:hypothetical protein [Sphaerisporangium rhizosphaerae]|uniref:Uncharacterized protein n=1 Tax=Sphaerisporangium rhizosphaerae TaxID=2269375 RepID=A0ABW2P888_9ACTN